MIRVCSTFKVIDMKLDKTLLDNLLAQAAENPRLRQNYDLRTSATSAAGSGTGSGQALPEDGSQRMLNALLPGTVIPAARTSAAGVCSGRLPEYSSKPVERFRASASPSASGTPSTSWSRP